MKLGHAPRGPQVPAVSTMAGRRVHTVGGILMVTAGLLAPLAYALLLQGGQSRLAFAGLFLSQVTFSTAVILFAVGWGGRGSVVAGHWVGMVALVAYAVARIAPFVLAWIEDAELPGWQGDIWWPALLAGFVGVVEIARVGAVYGVGRWLPMVLLLLEAAVQILYLLVQSEVDGRGATPSWVFAAGVLLIAAFGGWFIGPLILGITALGQASSARAAARAAQIDLDQNGAHPPRQDT